MSQAAYDDWNAHAFDDLAADGGLPEARQPTIAERIEAARLAAEAYDASASSLMDAPVGNSIHARPTKTRYTTRVQVYVLLDLC